MIRTVVIGGEPFTYELTRKRVKNINLRVRRDGSIAVSCNPRVPITEVEKFIAANAGFIARAVQKTKQREMNTVRPVFLSDGDTVKVFGREYIVRIAQYPRNMVLLTETEVLIGVKDKTDGKLPTAVYERWRKKILREKVLEMCRSYYPFFEEKGVKWPLEIRFRTMKSRWGSCIPKKGILTFNYNLFEAPYEAAEYVVVHEFSHFLEANHSASFYRIVGSVLPDYKKRRSMLSEY